MDRTLDDVRSALAEQHAELWGILEGMDAPGWDRPSLCAGWSVTDVLLHMAQTEEMALASLEGRFDDASTALAAGGVETLVDGVDAGAEVDAGADAGDLTVDDFADLAVQRERGAPGVKVAARWKVASDGFLDALAEADGHRRVTWVTGQLSVLSLATTRLAECWIHTGDIAEPLNVEQVPADRLRHVARLAWRTLPYAFSRAGRELTAPVAFHLTGPDGAEWNFDPPAADDASDEDDAPEITVVEGDGVDLVRVAARRIEPEDTGLRATGPDADAVLDLVRTYA